MWIRRLLIVAAVLLIGPVLIAQASTLPTDFTESLAMTANSLSRPTSFAITPDGRLFITLQGDVDGGDVLVYENGALLGTPLITVPTNSQNEHGLLGIEIDPDFETNGYIYLYFTTVSPGSVHRISRFTVTGNTASLASEVVLLETDPIGTATWHHGGEMQFGTDGMLYIGFGDNLNNGQPGNPGATGSPHYSQQLTSLFGKIARIDPRDGPDVGTDPDVLIPPDNPFYNTASGKYRAIWAMGLRHPYKISTRPTDGKMLVTEVGNTSWEEINELAAGRNFGWPTTEGDFNPALPANNGFTQPAFFYAHGGTNTTGCAITAGAFYNPDVRMFPISYVGKFFFADYCNRWMRTYNPDNDTASGFATLTDPNVIAIEFSDVDGSMYYLVRTRVGATADNDTGHIYRMVYTGPQPPEFTVHPQDQTISLTQTATFSCSASGNPQPTYQWQRNNVNIPGATDDSYTTPPVTLGEDDDEFRCVATNTAASINSNVATLTVLDNMPPAPVINKPTAITLFQGGQTISFKGTATDPEDGTLPKSAFSWSVAFHHLDHVHPFMSPTPNIKKGKFTIPRDSHGSIDIYYRVYLTVTDSTGASTTTFVDIQPRLTTLTVETNPDGVPFQVDSNNHTTSTTWQEVVGMEHALTAPLVHAIDGAIYVFKNWSDGGSAAHTITAPTANTTYTANYTLIDVKNGSFENAASDGDPKQWNLSGLSGTDGQVCDQADEGTCSLLLNGGANNRLLKQDISLKGLAGDDLSLNLAAHTAGAAGFTVRVTLTHQDNSTQVQDLILSGSAAWGPRTINLIAAEDYKKVRIEIIAAPGSAGQLWLDSMHLNLNN
jgi:glucose/arabinose dehydrogenase